MQMGWNASGKKSHQQLNLLLGTADVHSVLLNTEYTWKEFVEEECWNKYSSAQAGLGRETGLCSFYLAGIRTPHLYSKESQSAASR